MQFDFTKVEMLNLATEKNEENMHKFLAQKIYTLTKNLDLVDVALRINKGEIVTLEKVEIEEVKRIISDDAAGLFACAKKAYLNYIESVVKQNQESK